VRDESQHIAEKTEKTEKADDARAQQADEFEGKTEDEILAELELPTPESLKLGDSVAGFMDARVPERIRHKALRAFWKTNPVLANVDGLDEYCEDFTDAVTVIENLQTIYQVGSGYASQALDALESLADEDSEASQVPDTQDHPFDPPGETGQLAPESHDNQDGDGVVTPSEDPASLSESPPLLGKRMQFRS
jgi:hypothetical protein